ncbi:MAG: ATP-binding protein [Acidimicrobiales bacterium]|jgi:anti-sigma regulatory factor (Ser/Thr protein kinase)|nr:ATP-binding protein [Acidimicrobiales bacterium]
MSGIVELRVPAVPEYLQMVRSVVGAAASTGANLKPERVSDLRLAVSEAATNAMEAHGLSGVEDRVVIRCDLSASQIEVEVADCGPGFDPNSLPPLPDVDSPDRLRHESGLGVSLMYHLTDETIVESHGEGTAVRLIVHFGD